MISSHWSDIKPGFGLIKLANASAHYAGYYIKFSESHGSLTFTATSGIMRIWAITAGNVTMMNK